MNYQCYMVQMIIMLFFSKITMGGERVNRGSSIYANESNVTSLCTFLLLVTKLPVTVKRDYHLLVLYSFQQLIRDMVVKFLSHSNLEICQHPISSYNPHS